MDIRQKPIAAFCLAVAFAGLAGYGQQAAPPAAATSKSENAFKTGVNEVIVPVTVTDSSGAEPIRAELVWAWVPRQRK